MLEVENADAHWSLAAGKAVWRREGRVAVLMAVLVRPRATRGAERVRERRESMMNLFMLLFRIGFLGLM